MMITDKYKPACEDMRKRLIGFKLGMIGKRQSDQMDKYRVDAEKLFANTGNNVKATEKLLESYYPNIGRMLMERSFKKKKDESAEDRKKAE